MKSDDVSKFRQECQETVEVFADYPWEYLAWMGETAYEAARDEMARRKVPKRIQILIDGALVLMLAAESVRAHHLDPVEGRIVAEALPGVVREIVAVEGGFPYGNGQRERAGTRPAPTRIDS